MKFSTSTGNRYDDYPSEEIRFKYISEAGFKYVNYDFQGEDFSTDDWREIARLRIERMNAAGLTPIMAHGPYGYPLKDEERELLYIRSVRALKVCKEMKIEHLVLHPDAVMGMSYDEFLSINVNMFRRLIPTVEDTGVMILIENIGQYCDPHFVRDGKELRKLIEEVSHPLFGACWDTGHANHVLEDQYDSIKELGPFLKGLHVNDNLGDLAPKHKHWMNDMHMVPMFGNTNFDRILQALKEINYGGYFNFEVDKPSWHGFGENELLKNVMPELRKHTLHLLYETGKLMLDAYGMLEE